MAEQEKTVDIEEAIALLETGNTIPAIPHTAEDVDSACKLAVAALQEKQEHEKAQAKFELRILRNYERLISKAYRQRTDNATLVHNILMAGTSTAGRTSCCEKCRELGIDPYGYEIKEE